MVGDEWNALAASVEANMKLYLRYFKSTDSSENFHVHVSVHECDVCIHHAIMPSCMQRERPQRGGGVYILFVPCNYCAV